MAEPRSVRELVLDRDFLLFWSGQAVSKTGNGMYQVGLAWTVYQVTGSTAVMGLVLALNFLPQLVLLLVGGAVSDRVPRRVVVLVSDGAAAAVTAGMALAAATNQLSAGVLMVGSLLLGMCSAFYEPAYAAMNPDLVPAADLHRANSVLTIATNTARVVGPAVGGVVFGLGGATLLFAMDSVSFVVAAAAMAAITGRPRVARPERTDATRGLFAGVRYTVRTRWLLVVSIMTVVANCACLAPFRVLLPALVEAAHGGPRTLGFLGAGEVVATVVGVLLVRDLRVGDRTMLALAAMAGVLGVGTVVTGLSGLTTAALVAGALLIGGGLAFNVIEMTLLQTRVPADLLSRVLSVNLLLSFSLLPLGYAATGLLAGLVGPHGVLVGGGLLLLGVCACVPFIRAGARRAGPPGPPPR